jgi:N-alpha-acetyltransferase 30
MIMKDKKLEYRPYTGEEQLDDMIALIERDLSEPYSIYTYRYFLLNFPQLSFLVYDVSDECEYVFIS